MRERMITRTVETANVKVMFVDVQTQEVSNTVFSISATIPQAKALAYIQKTFDSDTFKHVAILDYSVSETLYGMTEQDFIAHAKVLPPRFSTAE